MDDRVLNAKVTHLNIYDEMIISDIENLSPMQQKVARLRYGLDGGENRSINEIAEILGKSPMEIAMLEVGIYRRFTKYHQRRKKLRDFLH